MSSFIVNYLASLFDVDTNAVILLLSVLAAYPLMLVYVLTLRNNNNNNSSSSSSNVSPNRQCQYFFLTGFTIITLAYGFDSFHYLFNCLFCYCTLRFLATRYALVINFVFTLTYLLYGYHVNQLDWSYSITWTMAQCVLTLRLISISFDINDGQNKSNKDAGRHKASAISTLPPFLTYMAYCYFPGTLMVGPLVPYLSFYKFISSTNYNKQAIKFSIFRLMAGFFCLTLYMVGTVYWPVEYLQSESYYQSPLWWKMTAIAIVAKVYMYKYIAVWMLAEAACILSGITQDGLNYYEHTNVNWIKYELAHTCGTIIGSYNMTTNQFSFKYLYRRLKFLNNVHLSQLLTLLFLSVWHGYASGYYCAFFTEFLVIYFEKHLVNCAHQLQQRYKWNLDIWKSLIWMIGRVYTFYCIGYSFVPFMFLHIEHWYRVLSSVYFVGHIFLLVYVLISLIVNSIMRKILVQKT